MSNYSDLSPFSDISCDISDDISQDNIKENKNDYESLYDKIMKNFDRIDTMNNDINDKVRELNDYIKNVNKNKKDIFKELKKDLSVIDKLYKKNLSNIPKKRKKQNVIQGFNNLEPIPKEIKEYCGNLISPEINIASRPFVISALHKAFKRDNLKIGRDTILDKKASKILKREEGYKIQFHEYQKFLASYYRSINV